MLQSKQSTERVVHAEGKAAFGNSTDHLIKKGRFIRVDHVQKILMSLQSSK